ncbi:MAG: DUF4192 domain-containing protein [Micromonosporaceae bacterium]
MTRSSPPTLRLTQPADVLAAIPYLLGYHPAASAVVLALRGSLLLFTVRVDLPPVGGPPDDALAAADDLVRVVRAQRPTGAVVVGYGPAEQVDPVLHAVDRGLTAHGVRLREALRAADGRYWSYQCDNPWCCPPEGTPFDVSVSEVAATATLAGRAALPDRAAFEAQLQPVVGVARQAMRVATARARERLAGLAAAAPDADRAGWTRLRAGAEAIAGAIERTLLGGRLDDDDTAWLTVLLAAIPVRDLAWEQITGPIELLEAHSDLWLDVMRRAEPGLLAAPGSLFAFAAWRCGDGPLARLAVERVLAEDPTYSMASILRKALDYGVPPSALVSFPYGPARRRRGRRPRRRSSSRRVENRPA